jgi:urate oxidase
VYALARRRRLGEKPEPDALHASRDHVPARDPHGEDADYSNYRYHGAMPHIHSTSYGESRLRMLRVVRRGDRHEPRDLTIALRFEGRFDAAFRGETATALVPGEAVKNLVHRVVRDQRRDTIEDLALAISEAVLSQHPSIGLARIEVLEQPWGRLSVGGKPHGQAFAPAGTEQRTALVSSNGTRLAVSAGIEHLRLLRTAGLSADAASDQEADGLQRLLIASLSARWSYSSGDIAFGPYREGVRAAIVECFACQEGRSVQELLYSIADAILATYQEILSVALSMQEFPYRPADLLELAVGGDTLFVAHDEPLGLVEISVQRESAGV